MPPAAALAGKVVLGSVLAKKSRGGSSGGASSGNGAADLQAQIARDLYESTDPIRQSLIGRSTDYLTGGFGSSPLYNSYKSGIEGQYNVAKENIIGATPEGGALTAALANLETSRARDLTQAQAAVDESELARAMSLATGSTGQAIAGAGGAANIYAQMDAAKRAQEASKWNTIGAGLGSVLGYMGNK